MDPSTDMPDQPAPGGDAARPARAFGRVALVAYWIACLGVIAWGVAQMEWRRPRPTSPTPAAAAAPAVPVGSAVPPRTLARRAAPAAAAKPARPAPAAIDQAPAWEGFAPPPTWVGVLVLFAIGGLVALLWRPRRRRGSRQFGRFSGRRRRLGAMRGGFGRSWL